MTPVSAVEKINKITGKWTALPLRHQGKHQVAKLNIHPGDGELLHVMRQPGFLNNAGWGFTHADGSKGK